MTVYSIIPVFGDAISTVIAEEPVVGADDSRGWEATRDEAAARASDLWAAVSQRP